MVGLYITLPNVELTIFQIPINSKVSNCHKYERKVTFAFSFCDGSNFTMLGGVDLYLLCVA